MLHHSIVKGIFFITFLNVISTNPIMDICNLNCEGSDTKPVCVFDKSSVCFQSFPSECIMESIKCLFQKDFMDMHDSYCKLDGFQCVDKPWPKFQSPTVEEKLPYSYNKNDQERVEIVYKDIDNYEIDDEKRYYNGEDQASKRYKGDNTNINSFEDNSI